MARKPRNKQPKHETPAEPVIPDRVEVDEVTEQKPAPTLQEFVQEQHGQMDQPQADVPNISWFKANFDTKSAAIRYCHEVLHMETKTIAKHLGIRYQMCRNVLKAVVKRGTNEPLIPKSERQKTNPL